MLICTALLVVNSSIHFTAHTTAENSIILQDIISLVDLTCAAPPEHSAPPEYVYIHTCIRYNRISAHQIMHSLQQHLNTSKHEAAAKEEGKARHIRRLIPPDSHCCLNTPVTVMMGKLHCKRLMLCHARAGNRAGQMHCPRRQHPVSATHVHTAAETSPPASCTNSPL